jgi:hypothetical protein
MNRPILKAIVTDVHFWVPVVVLLLGVTLLLVLARDRVAGSSVPPHPKGEGVKSAALVAPPRSLNLPARATPVPAL